ncbi:MAG TPA: 3-methyl-2-oxobutanoate hydroxymethyltransferase, partial [Candidatus Deferrimicrobium sp.]|nr:3-methyl-2-oxobutanoate hydroxymethyltransferase [Candidatus Deferrimicrobium sp.]
MRKTNILDLARMKADGQKIVMITAYDALFARIFDDAGVDVILVGDSLGMVVLGHPDTLNVTMEDMVRHTAAAARGRKRAFLAADMPFLSYQACAAEAIRNAGRLLQAGAEAVKLEGGRNAAETIRAIASAVQAWYERNGMSAMRNARLRPRAAASVCRTMSSIVTFNVSGWP